MQKNTVKFGIIGCGMIANYHAQAIKFTDNAELIGACSKTFSNTQKFCKKFNIHDYNSYEEMLSDKNIDVVSICTPSGLHFEQAAMALKAGKHLIIEKPICLNLEDTDKLIKTAEKLNLSICMVSQSRFTEASQSVKNAILNGDFGKIISASLTMRYIREQSYYNSAQWRGTVAGDGGGILMNQGIHGIDLLCYLIGKPIKVCGYSRTQIRDIEVEDTVAAAIEFENGTIATINATVCSNPSFPKKIAICGENGTVILEEDAIVFWSLPVSCPIEIGVGSGDSGSASPNGISDKYHILQYKNMINHLLNCEELNVDAEQGRIALSVILGIYEASNLDKSIIL